MTTYQVADGFDNEAGLTDVSPQPMSEGIKPTRRTFAGSGYVYDQAKYVELEFNMVPDVTTYQSILTQFGVLTAVTNDVTVKIRDEVFNFVNMNGTVIRPEPGRDVRWNRFFPRNVVILIKDLAAT